MHATRQQQPAPDFIQPAAHLQSTQLNAPINTDLQNQARPVNMHSACQQQPAPDFIQPAAQLQSTQMNARIDIDLQQQPLQASTIVDDSSNMYQLVDGTFVSMDELIVSTGADDADGVSASANTEPTTSNADASILSLLSNIANSVAKIATNQAKYDRRMDKMEANIGLILRALSIDVSSNASGPSNNEPPGALVSRFKPIDTVDELDLFEKRLQNPAFFAQTVRYTKFIFSTLVYNNYSSAFMQFENLKLACSDSKMSEINLAYSIVDILFTRRLFERVSWTGYSKTEDTKAAFQGYKRVLAFFIALIRVIHPNYPEVCVFDFFKKKIISCAKARAKSSRKRISREKHRKRILLLNTELETMDEDFILEEGDENLNEYLETEIETTSATNNGDEMSNEATPFDSTPPTIHSGEAKIDVDGHYDDPIQVVDDATICDSGTKIEAKPIAAKPMAMPKQTVSTKVSKKASSVSTKPKKATKPKRATNALETSKRTLKSMSVKRMMKAMLDQIKQNKDPESESSSMSSVSMLQIMCTLIVKGFLSYFLNCSYPT